MSKLKLQIIIVLFVVICSSISYAGYYDDFQIVSFTTYANALGDRYAKVKENTAGGSRLINPDAFACKCTDGTKLDGQSGQNIRAEPGETVTVLVPFGRYKWPVEEVFIK